MKELLLAGLHEVKFDPREDIEFLFSETFALSSECIDIPGYIKKWKSIAETYYSIGGGFVIKEGEDQCRFGKCTITLSY